MDEPIRIWYKAVVKLKGELDATAILFPPIFMHEFKLRLARSRHDCAKLMKVLSDCFIAMACNKYEVSLFISIVKFQYGSWRS